MPGPFLVGQDLLVDFQALFDHCYKAGNGADALLREKGLRH